MTHDDEFLDTKGVKTRFYLASSNTASRLKMTGTGFGLSIVREIVEARGWKIRVVDHDSGARFVLETE